MKRYLALFCILPLLGGCATTGGPYPVQADYDPSIERGLELISKTAEGKKLCDYLNNNPIEIKYGQIKGPWPKLDPDNNRILIPAYAKQNDLLVGVMTAKALALMEIYRGQMLTEIVAEAEELSLLAQLQTAFEAGFKEDAAKPSPAQNEILSSMCRYIVEGQSATLEAHRRKTMAANAEYGWPLDTAKELETWLDSTREAIDDNSFSELIYRRDMEKLRKGAITRAQADANAARAKTLTPEELKRIQREFYYKTGKTMADFLSFYTKKLQKAEAWRNSHDAMLSEYLGELPFCNRYVPAAAGAR